MNSGKGRRVILDMMSLAWANNNDISFAEHMHRSITVHEKQLPLKNSNNTLKIELCSWQPSFRLDSE